MAAIREQVPVVHYVPDGKDEKMLDCIMHDDTPPPHLILLLILLNRLLRT